MRKEGIILVGIGLITLLIVVGAAFLLSGPSTPSTPQGEGKVSDTQLLLGPEQERMSEGTPSAKVTMVEFGDFQCPACGAAHPIVKQIVSEYKDRVYFIFRNFPLPMHPNAPLAAQAAYAAGIQGKFWEMHDKLYESQDEWAEKSGGPAKETIVGYAKDLGLDLAKFNDDLNKNVGNAKIQKDQNDGYQLGVNSTPTFYINGTKFAAVMTYDQLKKEIDDRLK
jgi:protein-disulfide isomerase